LSKNVNILEKLNWNQREKSSKQEITEIHTVQQEDEKLAIRVDTQDVDNFQEECKETVDIKELQKQTMVTRVVFENDYRKSCPGTSN
jgi:hypothetical protein